MLLKAFGELAAGGGKSFPGARKRQLRQCSHTCQSIYRSVWNSVFDPSLSQKGRWCEDGPGRDIQERKAAWSIVPCWFRQCGAQAWRNWVSLVLLREWLSYLVKLKRTCPTYMPLKSFYRVVFPLSKSQGNVLSAEFTTFDITLGCPALGVTRKPRGKSLQKKKMCEM